MTVDNQMLYRQNVADNLLYSSMSEDEIMSKMFTLYADELRIVPWAMSLYWALQRWQVEHNKLNGRTVYEEFQKVREKVRGYWSRLYYSITAWIDSHLEDLFRNGTETVLGIPKYFWNMVVKVVVDGKQLTGRVERVHNFGTDLCTCEPCYSVVCDNVLYSDIPESAISIIC